MFALQQCFVVFVFIGAHLQIERRIGKVFILYNKSLYINNLFHNIVSRDSREMVQILTLSFISALLIG